MATLTEQALGDISGIPGGFDLDIGLGLSPIPDPKMQEALHWTPPLQGPPVYPPSFRQETIDILEANPGLDSDMVRHYVRGKEIGEKWGPTLGSIGGYAKEALDWMWPGSRAGFSLDDLLASETGIKGKSVQEALDAGVFKHTERGVTGYGQGLWDDVSRKAETLDIDMSPAEMLKGFVGSPFRMQHEVSGPSGPSRRGGYRYRSPVSGVDALDANMQRGGYRGAALRTMPEAFAETLTAPGSTYDPALGGMSPVPDIPGITEMQGTLDEALREGAISRGLEGAQMDFREPRIRFSLPEGARGVFPEEVQTPFIFEQQYVDPYTSQTTLPIGEQGWRPDISSDTLGGPVVGRGDGTITYQTNAEAMASDVQRALDRAGRIGPTPPVTAPEAQLQALTELAQTDPTIAERYTDPGSQDLIDIATQQESFANIPETPWTPQAPVIPVSYTHLTLPTILRV